jgi:hypothetical protein
MGVRRALFFFLPGSERTYTRRRRCRRRRRPAGYQWCKKCGTSPSPSPSPDDDDTSRRGREKKEEITQGCQMYANICHLSIYPFLDFSFSAQLTQPMVMICFLHVMFVFVNPVEKKIIEHGRHEEKEFIR